MPQLLTPPALVDYIDDTARAKAGLSAPRLVVMAFLGGVYIAVGALLALVIAGGAGTLAAQNPGLAKLLFGAVFPVGFIAVVLTGADLFTSNCATQMVPWFRRRIAGREVLRVWALSYAGNLLGALFTAYCFAHLTGLLDASQPAAVFVQKLAAHKLDQPFMVVFMKGVLANMLVCIAAWQGYSAKDTLGRMAGIWLPVMAFVALGMEHSIANLFFVPAAMLAGLDVTTGDFIIHNLIPATLGNIVGGAIMVGLPYAWLYSAPAAVATVNVDRATNRQDKQFAHQPETLRESNPLQEEILGCEFDGDSGSRAIR
ncbi:formate/nitrite transporter [Andreprevotia lacus DSM 23236]|jgi:formate/nitrite transporter|uniref:Formate/nitrite transporter n=1 Tax=Andreprevotia lacus DSM 23236 TaxID=1121001 RepID=A0A1W1XWD5_9NEIS|nr:formate/nitrite transporter family protein [Andreprevotia lacus]SMC28279.1 formate/nitrite transporter [Andreprevotia lacus DSM 23236]